MSSSGWLFDQLFMWAFVVAAVFAVFGYPVVTDAETGVWHYSLSQFQDEISTDYEWLMNKKKGAVGVLVGISLVVGVAAGYVVPKVSREGVNN